MRGPLYIRETQVEGEKVNRFVAVYEWLMVVVMSILFSRAVTLIYGGLSNDIVKPFEETVVYSIPLFAVVCVIAIGMMLIGKRFSKANIISNGLLLSISAISYTIAAEYYLVGLTVAVTSGIVLSLGAIVCYSYEKKQYRNLEKSK